MVGGLQFGIPGDGGSHLRLYLCGVGFGLPSLPLDNRKHALILSFPVVRPVGFGPVGEAMDLFGNVAGIEAVGLVPLPAQTAVQLRRALGPDVTRQGELTP